MTKVQFGCECKDCGIMCECTHSCAPVAFLVGRKGKRIKVCTRCDLSSDKIIKLLLDKNTPMKHFFDYDALGALCLSTYLNRKQNKNE